MYVSANFVWNTLKKSIKMTTENDKLWSRLYAIDSQAIISQQEYEEALSILDELQLRGHDTYDSRGYEIWKCLLFKRVQ